MPRRFGIGDRVMFTEFACLNVNIPVLYRDVNLTLVYHSYDYFHHSVSKNIDTLSGIISGLTENTDNYSILFEYGNEFFYFESCDVFLKKDTKYYRNKSIEDILEYS